MEYRISQIIDEIQSNLKTQITIEAMARQADLSNDHFTKLFKKTIVKTPIQYVRDKRLEKSCELLKATNKRIKTIMSEVGIRDQTHFVRDFKAKYGSTPNEYRQKYWDKIQTDKAKIINNGNS
jgi:transcriptional regulator GlxA family with amidase domain